MPTYTWSCLACGRSNAAESAECIACGCPATPTVRQIDEARLAQGGTPAIPRPSPQFNLSSKKELRRSALWALAISLPVSVLGWSASMALAHSGNALVLLLFAPAAIVVAVFGTGGPFEGLPKWLFLVVAAIAQFIGYLVVIHGVRLALQARSMNDG